MFLFHITKKKKRKCLLLKGNKANETKYVRYDNCKILDFDGNDECAVLAEKITLIENI